MKTEECTELKNIQYQTMLLNGNNNNIINKPYNTTKNIIDVFLQREKEINRNESWNKLDRSSKNRLLFIFSKDYANNNNLAEDEGELLHSFLKNCLDRKRLVNNKEVIYCKLEQKILEIPLLKYENNKFGLDRLEKKVSTLKSLTPIKPRNKNKL